MTILPSVNDVNPTSRGWNAVYWTCQIAGWGAYVAIGLSMVIPQAGPQPFIIGGYILFFFYSILLTHFLRRQIRRHEWLALSPGAAGVRLLTAAIIVGTVQAFLIVVVQSIWTRTPLSAASGSFFLLMWGNTTAAMFVWTALYSGTAALVRGRRLRQDAIALELGMREARLKALEAQIGPHFLFNCLNSLRGLILENPVQAQDMVTRLANILRHNLARDSDPSEPLSVQIALTTDYLALESIRFEERLRTRFVIEPATQTFSVPAMLLQTLVENALKHGISHLPAGGEVAVRSFLESDALVIAVENTGRLIESPSSSTRVGLANLRERLRVLHGPGAILEVSETAENTVRALVRIPRHEPEQQQTAWVSER